MTESVATTGPQGTTGQQQLSETTEWVTPFPEGDPLNDPWFRDVNYVFTSNKTELVIQMNSFLVLFGSNSLQEKCFGNFDFVLIMVRIMAGLRQNLDISVTIHVFQTDDILFDERKVIA